MNNTRLGFLRLDNRYAIEGRLIPDGALHVGSGLANERSDAAFMRDATGPLIPGSSLRGVMRSRLERILQSLGGDRGCVLFAPESHPTCFTANEKAREAFENSKPTEEELNEKLINGGGLCDICKLFGSDLFASKLRIEDSRPTVSVDLTVRDGVGIDRDTETAREKIKFDFEVLERGKDLTFRMELENADARDFALLDILLTEMTQTGIDVGGKKSRGLGRMKLGAEYKVRFFDSRHGYGLTEFLKAATLKEMLPANKFAGILREHLNDYLKEDKHAAASGE